MHEKNDNVASHTGTEIVYFKCSIWQVDLLLKRMDREGIKSAEERVFLAHVFCNGHTETKIFFVFCLWRFFFRVQS